MDFENKINLIDQIMKENSLTEDKYKTDHSSKLEEQKIKTPQNFENKKQDLNLDNKETIQNQSKEKDSILKRTKRPELNARSLISLTLPYIEYTKYDQDQVLNMIKSKNQKYWQYGWVLIPNVFDFIKEISQNKWILRDDGGECFSDLNLRVMNKLIFHKI